MNIRFYILSMLLLLYSPSLWAGSALDDSLINAAKTGNQKSVDAALQRGANINFSDRNGNTALLYAALRGDYALVNYLLEKGALPNLDNRKGFSALNLSCIKGYLSSIEFLLKHGADLNQANADGKTPLMLCAEYNQKVAAEILLKHKAKVNVQDKYGNTALHIAMKSKHDRMAILLMSDGADFTIENRDNEVPVEYILKNDDEFELELIKKLCDMHPKLITATFSQKKTLLMIVAAKNCPKIAQYLVEKGAKINAKDSEGLCALIYALYANSTEMVTFLLSKGAKVSDISVMGFALIADHNPQAIDLLMKEGFDINNLDSKGCTALHIAINYNLLKLCRLLLKNGAKINMETAQGESPLGLAVLGNKDDIVRFLLESGADVNQADPQGNTPLMKACLVGNSRLAELLISRGAYLLAKNKAKKNCYDLANSSHRSSVLEVLAKYGLDKQLLVHDDISDINFHKQLISGSYALVQHLIKIGANVNGVFVQRGGYESNHGERQYFNVTEPMLHAATKNKNFAVIKLLVDHGAKLDVTDNDGHTALYAAIIQKRLDIVKYLVEKGLDTKVHCQNGDTLLMLSCYAADIKLVSYFIEKGVSVNDIGGSKGASPLICATESGQGDKFKIMNLLLSKGANIDYSAPNTGTALHRACALSDLACIEFLLKNKANPSVKNEQGMTPLALAQKDNRVEIVKLLTKYGALE